MCAPVDPEGKLRKPTQSNSKTPPPVVVTMAFARGCIAVSVVVSIVCVSVNVSMYLSATAMADSRRDSYTCIFASHWGI